MEMNSLQAAIEQATSEKHSREFEVGGQVINFPRLSSFDQGKFEDLVRVKRPEFTIGGARNKAALIMSGVMRTTKQALAKIRVDKGLPLTAVTAEDAMKMAEDLQQGIQERFMPMADKLLGGFTRDQGLFAVAMSLVASYETDEITYTIDVDGKPTPITEKIDSVFVDKLFAGESGTRLDIVVLYVTGLSEQPPAVEKKLEAGMTADEIADETIGNEGNSDREQVSE